jgi:5-methyltetrahydrofolate--homocysteine methyltransferase
MLNDFIARKRVRLNGIVGIYPANSVGDDIEIYSDDAARGEVRARFYGLRQQAEKEGDEPYLCVSDFIAPRETDVPDYLGAFACSAGHGLEEVVAEYKEAGDDYR